MFGTLNIALVIVTLAVAAAFAAPVGRLVDLSPVRPIVVAGYLAGMLLYQYARGVAFSRLLPGTVLKLDLLYVGSGTLLIGATYLADGDVELGLVLGSLACAGILAGTIGLAIQPGAFRLCFRREELGKYRNVYQDGKWALIGVITYEVQTRSYVYVVTAFAGPAALAELMPLSCRSAPSICSTRRGRCWPARSLLLPTLRVGMRPSGRRSGERVRPHDCERGLSRFASTMLAGDHRLGLR